MYSNKLFEPAQAFLNTYIKTWGIPDKSNSEFWELKETLDEIYKRSIRLKRKLRQPTTNKVLLERHVVALRLLSCCRVTYQLTDPVCVIAICESGYFKDTFKVMIGFNVDGSVRHVVVEYKGVIATKAVRQKVLTIFKKVH